MSAENSGICDSRSTTAVLMALNSSSTSFFCPSFSAGSSRQSAQQPSPTMAGVLGMMTTAGQASALYVLIRSRATPAAREISSLPVRWGAIFSSTARTCSGFTAISTTSACRAVSISSAQGVRPQRSRKPLTAAWLGSKPITRHIPDVPSFATPSRMAPPILPQPILPKVSMPFSLFCLCVRMRIGPAAGCLLPRRAPLPL